MNVTFHIPSKDTYQIRPWMRSVSVTQVSLESLRLQPLEVESLQALELERTESLWSELCGGGRALSQTAEHRVQRLHSLQGSYWFRPCLKVHEWDPIFWGGKYLKNNKSMVILHCLGWGCVSKR